MSTMRIVTALSLFAAACSSGGHGDDEQPVNCAEEMRDEDFVAGMQKTGTSGKLVFTLVQATPAPPARFDNTWVVQLTSAGAAAPVTGATMVVTPHMPDHTHTPISDQGQAMPEAGKYQAPVNFWMPGLWQTTIQATAGTDTDKAVFVFCVPS
ncbi:MAG: FixH family protein [Myxococcota bacterium]|nr:FixH family protein [Myxococcota bacterium]